MLFADRKKAFKVTEVTYINVPLWDELSVSNMLQMIGEDDDARAYFPDGYWKKVKPDRSYVFNVLNTCHPGYLDQLISHA